MCLWIASLVVGGSKKKYRNNGERCCDGLRMGKTEAIIELYDRYCIVYLSLLAHLLVISVDYCGKPTKKTESLQHLTHLQPLTLFYSLTLRQKKTAQRKKHGAIERVNKSFPFFPF